MTSFDLLQHAFLQRALLAGALVAAICALLGVFLVLRGYGLLGDGIAHLSFGGVAIGLAAGVYPLAVALLFAILGAVLIQQLRERRLVTGDVAIGILFTAGLAIGILVVSATSGFGTSTHAYLFGSILAIRDQDLWLMAGLAAGLFLLLALFQKEFRAITFNEEAARVAGIPVGVLNVAFMAMTAAAIVVAARIVGILLVSSLLIVPAAASLQVSRGFRVALMGSLLIALLSTGSGIVVAVERGWATGATIALASVALFSCSLTARVLRDRRAAPAGDEDHAAHDHAGNAALPTAPDPSRRQGG